MQLTSTQKAVASSPSRFRVIRSGRRWGKTMLSVEEMIFCAATNDDARVVYLAPTFQAARDIAWEALKKRIKDIGADINETRLEVEIPNKFGTKSKIMLRSWDAVETLRGQYFDFIVLDEIAHVKSFWSNWQEVLRPTLTDRKGKALFISTPLGYNHFYDLCNAELTDTDFKTFHFTSYDNPHLPKEEIDKAKQTLPSERFHQEYLASFQKTQGLVYKEFDRKRHLYTVLPPVKGDKFGAIDFGFTNPAAVLDIRVINENIYVEDVWYKKERTEDQIADYVAASQFQAVYPDPENASAIEAIRRRGVNVREVVKGKDSISSGIQKIRELLNTNRLKINAKCVNLISEFEMYSYDDEIPEKNQKENPIKANDHALDALRYFVLMYQPTQALEAKQRQYFERNQSNFLNNSTK